MNDYYADIARDFERAMRWEEAANAWDAQGSHVHAAACRRIATANEKGDRFRARVKELQAEGFVYWIALIQANKEIYGGQS